MKKYRFGEIPGSKAWWKNSNLLYFFVAWNTFGICVYQYFKHKNNPDVEEWKKLKQSQKYLSFMSNPEDELSVVKIKGFKVEEKKDTTVGEYIIPAPPSAPTSTT